MLFILSITDIFLELSSLHVERKILLYNVYRFFDLRHFKATKLNNAHDELTEIDIQTVAMALSCTFVGWTFSNVLALNH